MFYFTDFFWPLTEIFWPITIFWYWFKIYVVTLLRNQCFDTLWKNVERSCMRIMNPIRTKNVPKCSNITDQFHNCSQFWWENLQNESTPVANLTFEVNIIAPTYVTTEKVRKSVLPPPPPKQKVPSYRNFIFWVLRVHHLARKFGKFNQNHNIIGNIEFIKRYTHHKVLWKMLNRKHCCTKLW